MFTDITKHYNHFRDRINEAVLLTDPWPHLYITEVFPAGFYRTVCEFENIEGIEPFEEEGRINYPYNGDSEYDDFTAKLFSLLAAKFEYHTELPVPATTNFWTDTDKLLINDIHIDAFKDCTFTLSGQVYLPVDTSQRHYGTILYSYEGNDIKQHARQDPGTAHPHTAHWEHKDKFKQVRTVPFMPNTMLVTTNHIHSWHQPPCILDGDIRKSLMWRWKV